MILFLAQYPKDNQQQEGMSQRILAIDDQFENHQRVYLFISLWRYFRMERKEIKPGVYQYRCHSLFHFFFILSLFKQAGIFYIHSVIHLLAFLPFFPFIPREAKVVWDIHGLAVEEQLMAGAKMRAALYSYCERKLVYRADVAVAVTQSMIQYLKGKYATANPSYSVCSILPAHILQNNYLLEKVNASDTLQIIYSGNTQKWQNVGLMLDLIKNNMAPHVHYTILTGDLSTMEGLMRVRELWCHANITLKKVDASELKYYYAQAHYGFILRDDVSVNQVACPTKLIEYLYYGIVPIVMSANIGDFMDMGYQYIHYDVFNTSLPPVKSHVNRTIVEQLLRKDQKLPLDQIITDAI